MARAVLGTPVRVTGRPGRAPPGRASRSRRVTGPGRSPALRLRLREAFEQIHRISPFCSAVCVSIARTNRPLTLRVTPPPPTDLPRTFEAAGPVIHGCRRDSIGGHGAMRASLASGTASVQGRAAQFLRVRTRPAGRVRRASTARGACPTRPCAPPPRASTAPRPPPPLRACPAPTVAALSALSCSRCLSLFYGGRALPQL